MNRYKILVVDDDLRALELIETLLKPQGYDVVLIADSTQVVQAVNEEKPNLILLDIMMPIEDGYTVLAEIRGHKTLCRIPIVMVTALDQDFNKEVAGKLGAYAYITKPIKPDKLIETVAHFLPAPMS